MKRATLAKRLLLVGLFVLPVLTGAVSAKLSSDHRNETLAEWRKIPVVPPEGAPPVSQESLDLAIAMYGIVIPPSTDHPLLDRTLHDRGLTGKDPITERYMVKIGPSAFTSWSLLGSTLAHELEVHCRQNFLWIALQDAFGFQGTIAAEREAYQYELSHADRFGLAKIDRSLISETMDFYYPDSSTEPQQDGFAARLTDSINEWLARRLPDSETQSQ